MKNIPLNKSVIGIYLVILSVVPLSACAGSYKDKTQIIPKDASIVVSIGPKSGVRIIDAETGEALKSCSLGCTDENRKKYPELCREANENSCKGLVDATVTDATNLTILRSFKNPFCITLLGNPPVQKCKPPLQ